MNIDSGYSTQGSELPPCKRARGKKGIGLEVTRFADYLLYHHIEDGASARRVARGPVEFNNEGSEVSVRNL